MAYPDCYIQPWGAPPWETPDIWADNNGNGIQECGEPSLGIVNQLWARVHNIGTSTATNVQVKFFYAPYGMGYPHTHFKQIGITATIASIPAASSTVIQTSWDLSNLSENNGGLWPYPISMFDHFCVRVEITCESDSNTENNAAQNNFTAVTCSDCSFNFLIVNPTNEQASAGILTSNLPKGWHVRISAPGIDSLQNFELQPNEIKLASLRLDHPDGSNQTVDQVNASLQINGELVGGITFKPVSSENMKVKLRGLSFHLGKTIPLASCFDTCNSGFSIITDFEYPITRNLSALLLVGINNFQTKSPIVDNINWWNVSANLKWHVALSSNIDLCINAGPGMYLSRFGTTEAGINAGWSWTYSLASDCKLEFGHDYHKILNKSNQFIVTHLGVIYGF